jgi:signal transduction histidine kinase
LEKQHKKETVDLKGLSVLHSSETTMAWVTPGRLDERWLPEMFRAKFIELDDFLQNEGPFVRLDEIVEIAHKLDVDVQPIWRVEASGLKRSLGAASFDESRIKESSVLPEEALLVSRTWSNEPSVHYWNSEIVHGSGSASSHYFVLKSKTGGSIAWLKDELLTEYVRLQFERNATGTLNFSLSVSDLLSIRVRIPSVRDRENLNVIVSQDLRRSVGEIRSPTIRKSRRLSGVSFEGNITELENLLVSEGLFTSDRVFFVQPATRNRDSDLFTVRSLKDGPILGVEGICPQDSPSSCAFWRNWFWQSPLNDHHIFNSLLTCSSLPPHLHARMVNEIPDEIRVLFPNQVLPDFAVFCEAVLQSLREDVGVEDQIWKDVWTEIQESRAIVVGERSSASQIASDVSEFRFQQKLFEWASDLYRPVLAIKVKKDGELHGAYLLVGENQVGHIDSTFFKLDDAGVALVALLTPSEEFETELLRKESARRLSDIMHRLGGPLLNATDALEHISGFLSSRSDIAQLLVPDDAIAKSMAAMNRDSSTTAYRLDSQFSVLKNAIEQIQNVSHRLKTLSRLEQPLSFSDFDMMDVIEDITRENAAFALIAKVERVGERIPLVCADRDLITIALERVIENSIREFREKNTESPVIYVTISSLPDRVDIEICDNALPASERLPSNVFEEGVSNYFRVGKGSGFGLTIVQRTFARHGTQVSLFENTDDDSERIPGVTFKTSLPYHVKKEEI